MKKLTAPQLKLLHEIASRPFETLVVSGYKPVEELKRRGFVTEQIHNHSNPGYRATAAGHKYLEGLEST